MSKKAEDGWFNKNGKPSRIPPYKAPRQTSSEVRGQTRPCAAVEDVTVIEDKGKGEKENKGKEAIESDSEEETQFGVVWEKYIIPETEEQMSDIDGDRIPPIETAATLKGNTVDIEEIPTGEACVGKVIMKRFDQGLFKGTIMTARKNRGRFLYHVVYEHGDSEDLNEKECSEAYGLFTRQLQEKGTTSTMIEALDNEDDDSDKELDKSGEETGGSEYDVSEEDEVERRKKKRRTMLVIKKTKEKALRNGGPNNQKEADAKSPRTKT
jgi:hypothetical protein